MAKVISIRSLEPERELRPSIGEIIEAARRIEPHIERTEVRRVASIDAELEASVFFKLENRQVAGSFKSRGACNAVFSLDASAAARGVVTHSSGNHAAALARAAARRGIAAYIVMPETAAPAKVANVRHYGAEIIFCAPTQAAREAAADDVRQRTGAVLIHPYDDARIIAGAATAAFELGEAVDHLDLVVAPVGGGGLLAGTARTVESLWPWTRCWGAEPVAAGDAWQSLQRGRRRPQRAPHTVADGLRTSLGQLNFEFIRRWVDEIVLVGESDLLRAARDLETALELPVERSSGVVLAALRARRHVIHGRRIGVIVSGGVTPSTSCGPADDVPPRKE